MKVPFVKQQGHNPWWRMNWDLFLHFCPYFPNFMLDLFVKRRSNYTSPFEHMKVPHHSFHSPRLNTDFKDNLPHSKMEFPAPACLISDYPPTAKLYKTAPPPSWKYLIQYSYNHIRGQMYYIHMITVVFIKFSKWWKITEEIHPPLWTLPTKVGPPGFNPLKMSSILQYICILWYVKQKHITQ